MTLAVLEVVPLGALFLWKQSASWAVDQPASGRSLRVVL